MNGVGMTKVATPYDVLLQLGKRPKQRGLIATRRRWFDGDGEGAPEQDGQRDAGGQDWKALPEWARTEYESLREQLSRVNNESAQRRHQLKTLEQQMADLQADREKRLTAEEKLAEYEQRLQSLQSAQERVEALEERIRASNQQRIQQIPEHMRAVVPENLTPQAMADYLDKAFPVLTRQTPPPIEGGSGYSGGAAKNPAEGLTSEELEIAKATGVTPEDYAKYKARINKRDG